MTTKPLSEWLGALSGSLQRRFLGIGKNTNPGNEKQQLGKHDRLALNTIKTSSDPHDHTFSFFL